MADGPADGRPSVDDDAGRGKGTKAADLFISVRAGMSEGFASVCVLIRPPLTADSLTYKTFPLASSAGCMSVTI